MLSSMEARMGVRLEVIGVKLIVFICARVVKFRSKWQSRGQSVCRDLFGSGVGFCEAVSVALREFKF